MFEAKGERKNPTKMSFRVKTCGEFGAAFQNIWNNCRRTNSVLFLLAKMREIKNETATKYINGEKKKVKGVAYRVTNGRLSKISIKF